jgi:hypothetical protein
MRTEIIEFPFCKIRIGMRFGDCHLWEELTVRWFLVTLGKRLKNCYPASVGRIITWSEISERMRIYCYEWVSEYLAKKDWQDAFEKFHVQKKVDRILKHYKEKYKCAG